MAMVQIEHWRKTKVHPAGPQLTAQHVTTGCRRIAGIQRARRGVRCAPGRMARRLYPHIAQRTHGRQVGESIGLESLNPATLVVYRNQQIGPYRFNAFA